MQRCWTKGLFREYLSSEWIAFGACERQGTKSRPRHPDASLKTKRVLGTRFEGVYVCPIFNSFFQSISTPSEREHNNALSQSQVLLRKYYYPRVLILHPKTVLVLPQTECFYSPNSVCTPPNGVIVLLQNRVLVTVWKHSQCSVMVRLEAIRNT